MYGKLRTLVIFFISCQDAALAAEPPLPSTLDSTGPWGAPGPRPGPWKGSWQRQQPPRPSLRDQGPISKKLVSAASKPSGQAQPTIASEPELDSLSVPPPPEHMNAAIHDLSHEATKLQDTIDKLLQDKTHEVNNYNAKKFAVATEHKKQEIRRKKLSAVTSQVSQAGKDNQSLRERLKKLEDEKHNLEQQLLHSKTADANGLEMKMESVSDTAATQRYEMEMKTLQTQKASKEKANDVLKAQIYNNEETNDKLRSDMATMKDSGILGIDREDTISRFVAQRRELDRKTQELKDRQKILDQEMKELFDARPGSPGVMTEMAVAPQQAATSWLQLANEQHNQTSGRVLKISRFHGTK